MSDSTRTLQKLTSLGLTGAAVDASCPPQPRQYGSAYRAGEEALADSTEMSSAAGKNTAGERFGCEGKQCPCCTAKAGLNLLQLAFLMVLFILPFRVLTNMYVKCE